MDPQKCSRSPLLSEHSWLSCALCLSSAARWNKWFFGSWKRASLLRATSLRICLKLRSALSALPPGKVNYGRDGVVNRTYDKGGPDSTPCETFHKVRHAGHDLGCLRVAPLGLCIPRRPGTQGCALGFHRAVPSGLSAAPFQPQRGGAMVAQGNALGYVSHNDP